MTEPHNFPHEPDEISTFLYNFFYKRNNQINYLYIYIYN